MDGCRPEEYIRPERRSKMKPKTGRGLMARLRGEKPPRTVYVGSHEDKLARLAPMRIDPDDDGRTLEDVRGEKAEGRGLYGGGPPSRLLD
jgi:hypothetical protein